MASTLMSRTPLVLVVLVLLCGCELFVIGGRQRRQRPIERSQRSAPGVVHLFAAELDSGNTTAATELLRNPAGGALLAIEKFELADDLVRWQTLIVGKMITDTKVDTVSATAHTVSITVDYIRKMQFTTISAQDLWWITRIQDVTPKR
jgi:hypothetical protein